MSVEQSAEQAKDTLTFLSLFSDSPKWQKLLFTGLVVLFGAIQGYTATKSSDQSDKLTSIEQSSEASAQALYEVNILTQKFNAAIQLIGEQYAGMVALNSARHNGWDIKLAAREKEVDSRCIDIHRRIETLEREYDRFHYRLDKIQNLTQVKAK